MVKANQCFQHKNGYEIDFVTRIPSSHHTSIMVINQQPLQQTSRFQKPHTKKRILLKLAVNIINCCQSILTYLSPRIQYLSQSPAFQIINDHLSQNQKKGRQLSQNTNSLKTTMIFNRILENCLRTDQHEILNQTLLINHD